MPTINVTEEEFRSVAMAANAASQRGIPHVASTLDRLARKINAALANASTRELPFRSEAARLKWTDVPSVLSRS